MTSLYLDHAAAAPCRPEVWEAMAPYHCVDFGNPNSLHLFGRKARQAVEDSRDRMAACLGCSGTEIVITSGGTESNNLAIRGAAKAQRHLGSHLITTKIEHPSTLRICASLESEGFEVTYLDVDRYGRVTPDQVAAAMRSDTVLVTIARANNEIGTTQPIVEIASAAKSSRPEVVVHTDALQTTGNLPIELRSSAIDLLSFAAYKFYGPKGVGGVYVKNRIKLEPLLFGGGDQDQLRPGTESVPLIVGMAAALELAYKEMTLEESYWTPVRDRIALDLVRSLENVRLNGHPTERLATNVSVSVAGISGEDLVLMLDRHGIYASSGSACTAGRIEPSHVLTAIGVPRDYSMGSLRLSFGHACRGLDTASLVAIISSLVNELRTTSYRPHHRTAEFSQSAA